VSLANLEQDIHAGDRILLDSSALIAYLNGGEPTSPVITHIVDDFLKRDRNLVIISMVTVMDVIVKPLRVSASMGRHALNFVMHTPNLIPQPIDVNVAHQAALLRAGYNFKTPDALVIATGLVHGVDVLVTNDHRWNALRPPPDMQVSVCFLDRYLPF
jgi:predicted nucleic acid-binding protein